MTFSELVEGIGKAVDLAGVLVMVVGVIGVAIAYALRLVHRRPSLGSYRQARQGVGRAILLGLELLVAGDIIRTVGGDPSFTSVGVLAIIVAIRTFLAMTLELEISGRWPWQSKTSPVDEEP